MMSPRLRFHRTQGQSVVLVALALLVLVGVAGLGLDGTNAFNQRRNVANAADAAAMAGTSELIVQRKSSFGSNTPVCQAVLDYLNNHGLNQGATLTWTASYVNGQASPIQTVCDSSATPVAAAGFAPSEAKGVTVTARYTFDTLFMQILGRSNITVNGEATAIYGPLGGPPPGGDVFPITVQHDVAVDMKDNPDDVAVFGTETGAYKGVPGAFGGVNLIPNIDHTPNGNASTSCPGDQEDTARSWWCNGTSHDITYDDYLLSNPGQVSNALVTEIKWRADNKPTGLVPVFDTVSGTGANAQYHIIGFLAVELLNESGDIELTGNPNDRHISAKYIDYYVTTGAVNNDPSALDTGVYAVNLVR